MTDRPIDGCHLVLVPEDWDQHPDAGEWSLEEDGLPFRTTTRAPTVTQDDEVLLLVGHDAADLDHSWVSAPGGRLHSGEGPCTGVVRKLVKESGAEIFPEDLEGPIAHREAIFRFVPVTYRRDEIFFPLHLPTRHLIRRDGWTCLERDIVDSISWWSVEQLRAAQQRGQEIYLVRLSEIVEEPAPGWSDRYLDLTDPMDHEVLTKLVNVPPCYYDPNI